MEGSSCNDPDLDGFDPALNPFGLPCMPQAQPPGDLLTLLEQNTLWCACLHSEVAQECIERAESYLEEARRQGDPLRVAAVLNDLVFIAVFFEDHERALTVLDEEITIRSALNDRSCDPHEKVPAIYLALLEKVSRLRSLGRHREAMAQARRNLRQARIENHPSFLIRQLALLGELYEGESRFHIAIQCYRACLALDPFEVTDRWHQDTSRERCAKLLAHGGQIAEALSLERAVTWRGPASWAIERLARWGRWSQSLGLTWEAQCYFQEALEHLENTYGSEPVWSDSLKRLHGSLHQAVLQNPPPPGGTLIPTRKQSH